MASAKARAWIERLAWILIYGGLLALVLGLATGMRDVAASWMLIVVGGVLAAAGIVLVYVRSRMSGP
jgi:hypothetical protein